jgi:hypothetical protein
MSAIVARPEAALLKGDGSRYTWLDLVKNVGDGVRETLLLSGTRPRFEDLAGWEFRGGNTTFISKVLGIRRFAKGFYEGPPRASGPEPFLQGYNVKVVQDADEQPHRLWPSPEAPKRHDYYRVYDASRARRDNWYPNALLLDYGLGGNGLFGAPLRDYLVQVYPDDRDLLLGKAYVALGPLRVPVGFFVLERLRRHDHKG